MDQSSSDDHESSSTCAVTDHSSLFLPPLQPPSSSSAFYADSTTLSSSTTYLNFVNNLISDDILNQPNLLSPPPPPSLPPSSRNPKKRTRASRKAPTTVLTTDTSNFRSMVQEFTGVPTSPFDILRSPSDPFTYYPFRPLIPSSILNHHHTTTSMNFYPQSHSSHQTPLSSLHDLDLMNLTGLQQNHHPKADDDDHHLTMWHFPEFHRPSEKQLEIHNNVSSSSLAPINDSSGTPTTTATGDPWICPTDSNY